eukprot:Nitzschia sp. Nitz4//scaffold99_size76975//45278//47195//NITZ4_005578-RA/size76975-processed-gene-0.48-mRNA-1//-1//CDS//3329560856//758//frame0
MTSADTDETCANLATESKQNEMPTLECGVYLAPSTIDNANLGIYTAKPLEKGDVVPYPEVVIPILFRNWDRHPDEAKGDGQLWDRYVWDGAVAGVDPYSIRDGTQQGSVFVPGVGCSVNSWLDLYNVESTHGSHYDSAPRGHPTTGSFSPYHGSETVASRYIPTGTELMASYGKSWIPTIPGVPVFLDEQLDEAETFVKRIFSWSNRMHSEYGDAVSPELLEKLWSLIRDFPQDSKVLRTLPTKLSWHEEENSSPPYDIRDYWRSQLQVPLDWLQTNGHCQDHLKPGPSTIPHAGRGAFAARDLPKGTVVGYAPLVHVENFESFGNIPYHSKDGGNPYSKMDLMINYSFGHANSTLLLTPYGAMVNYINHDTSHANVRIQWPSQEQLAHKPEWLNRSTTFLRHTINKVGLSFEYVALRDIEQGEEIFLDYGEDWQRAWDQHVANWVPPEDTNSYAHSSNYSVDMFKTIQEEEAQPYPPNLAVVCTESYRKEGPRYVWLPVLRDWHYYVPCDVLEHDGDRYTVRFQSNGENVTVYGVPGHEGIHLVDQAFSQDWHLPQAFRHQIGIPEDMFPSSWINRRTT